MATRRTQDSIVGPGFSIRRVGRSIIFESHRTPEQHQELISQLAEHHLSLPGIIKTKVVELEGILAEFDPFDMISHLSFLNVWYNPETYKEWAAEGKQAYVEFVTLLYLKRPYAAGSRRLISGTDIETIQSKLDSIFNHTIWYYATEAVKPDDPNPPTRLEDLRFRTITSGLMVRNPGYLHHLESLLKSLFTPLSSSLELQAGL